MNPTGDRLEQLLPLIPYLPEVITVDTLRAVARMGKPIVQQAVAAGMGKVLGRIQGKKGGLYRLKDDELTPEVRTDRDSPRPKSTTFPSKSRGQSVRDKRALSNVELEALADTRLAAAIEEELDNLTPRARAFALALGSGQPAAEAARTANLSTQSAALMRQKHRCSNVLRLLREKARRASMLTLEMAVEKFRALSEEARAAQDYSAAARALREACLLLDLYPSEKVDVTHRVNLQEVSAEEWERLAQLRHVVRQPLPAGERVLEAKAQPGPLSNVGTDGARRGSPPLQQAGAPGYG